MSAGIYSKVSLAATVRTAPFLANGQFSTIFYAVRTTGTATGSWVVQYSNDYVDGVDDPTSDAKWDTYTLPTSIADAIGSAQVFGVLLDFYEPRWVRIKFTRTGGSGTGEFWLTAGAVA